MKRLVLFLTVSLLVSLKMMAGSDLKLIKGSVLELKGSKATICAKWDYSNSTIEKKSIEEFLETKGEEWKRDYPQEIANA